MMLAKYISSKVFILATVTILIWYTNIQAQIVRDGLIHYWTFDKDHIKGEVAEDSIGQNDGKIIGKFKMVVGKIGEALQFEGTAGNYISLTPVSALSNHSFTIQVWISLTQHAYNIALSQGDAHAANRYLHFGTHKDTQAFMFRFYGDDQDGGSLDLNKWYHLVGVYDKNKSESYLYVNGEKVASKANCGGLKADPAKSDFEIGANYGRLGRADWFHGIIDEVGIYDRALSQGEVKQNYSADKGLAMNVEPMRKLSFTWGTIKKAL